MVWLNVVLQAPDQLRQRVAWALAQILTMSATGLSIDAPYVELYANYYDIFVRNAFGNFRQVLREVTYSPAMGEYLTYVYNTAFFVGGNYPDENYARELMQLFTIGLYKLNADGSQMLAADGTALPTYSNNDIVTFARIWTVSELFVCAECADFATGPDSAIAARQYRSSRWLQ
jgi:uncharacterized protein (DUF1800 family)